MKFLCALISVALLSALAIGCGSGSDETSGGDETTTVVAKKAFVKRGNAICDAYSVKRDKAMAAVIEEEGDLQAINRVYVEDALPIISRMTDELEELGQPDPGAATVAAIIASFRGGIEAIEEEPSMLATAEVSPFEEAKEKAIVYGLEACADF